MAPEKYESNPCESNLTPSRIVLSKPPQNQMLIKAVEKKSKTPPPKLLVQQIVQQFLKKRKKKELQYDLEFHLVGVHQRTEQMSVNSHLQEPEGDRLR